ARRGSQSTRAPRAPSLTLHTRSDSPPGCGRPSRSRRRPVASEKRHWCQGQVTVSPDTLPWNRGPPRCGQKLCTAKSPRAQEKIEIGPQGVSIERGRAGSTSRGERPVSKGSQESGISRSPASAPLPRGARACEDSSVAQSTLVLEVPSGERR